jgi:hypothetical protein
VKLGIYGSHEWVWYAFHMVIMLKKS